MKFSIIEFYVPSGFVIPNFGLSIFHVIEILAVASSKSNRWITEKNGTS